MTAQAIITELRALGVEVSAYYGQLRLVGTAIIPGDLVAAIREHKPVVLALLEQEAHVDVEVDQAIEAHVEQPATDDPLPTEELREQQVDQAEAHHVDVDFEAHVAALVEAFSDQAHHVGGVPFFTVPGSPDAPGGCLSCGEPLATPYPPRCSACIAAAHQVLATLAQKPAQNAPEAAPPVPRTCCPACGEGGLWRRVAGPDEAFCVRCGVVAEPTGPGPPPPRPRLYHHHHHEEVHHDGDHPPRNPAPGIRGRRQRRVLLAER